MSWLDAGRLAEDAAAAGEALAERPEVDPERVALVGHSQGGALVLRAAPEAPAGRIVTLGAPGRPLVDLPVVPDDPRGRLLELVVGRDVLRDTLERDPLEDAADAPQPALLVHGLLDIAVPPQDLLELARVRQEEGLPTRVLPVPGADHFVRVDGETPPAVLDEIAAFLLAAPGG